MYETSRALVASSAAPTSPEPGPLCSPGEAHDTVSQVLQMTRGGPSPQLSRPWSYLTYAFPIRENSTVLSRPSMEPTLPPVMGRDSSPAFTTLWPTLQTVVGGTWRGTSGGRASPLYSCHLAADEWQAGIPVLSRAHTTRTRFIVLPGKVSTGPVLLSAAADER